MEKIFLDKKQFNKFRIISDMNRYEIQDEENEKDTKKLYKNAGAKLVKTLRDEGYDHEICIYTSSEQNAWNKIAEFGDKYKQNVKVTTKTSVCLEFADY